MRELRGRLRKKASLMALPWCGALDSNDCGKGVRIVLMKPSAGAATGPGHRGLGHRRHPGLAWHIVSMRNSRDGAREAERALPSMTAGPTGPRRARVWNRSGTCTAWIAGVTAWPPFPSAAASPVAARSPAGGGHHRAPVGRRSRAWARPPRANGRHRNSSRRPWRERAHTPDPRGARPTRRLGSEAASAACGWIGGNLLMHHTYESMPRPDARDLVDRHWQML